MAKSGQCNDAIAVLARALDFSSHSVSDAMRHRLLADAAEFKKRGCSP